MEYVVMILALAAFAVCVFVMEGIRAKRRERDFIKSLYGEYEKLSDKKYPHERLERVKSFYIRHQKEGQLDDITWNDLGMDDIFVRMNYTLSAAGEEYLYYLLRSPGFSETELQSFESLIAYFGDHPDERVRLQYQMNELGYTGKYSLYDYIDNLDYLGERSNWKHYFFDALFLPAIVLLWISFPLGIVSIVGLTIFNIIAYFKEKGEIDPYICSFAYILRLKKICAEIGKTYPEDLGNTRDALKLHCKNLSPMCRNSFWVMMPGGRANLTSGDILSVLLDYIRMVFHVDLIKFNRMLAFLKSHIQDVDELISLVGYIETAISVWILRQTMQEGWCIPTFETGAEVEMKNGYHMLLQNPTKNSIRATKGVLLTGSNASGKSTFLKTVAVNAILAQTIHTCAAERFCTSFFHIYSSMALKDNLSGGESYYIVEIKVLKRIMDGAKTGQKPVLCFVDEVLRGTNTVERISASTQILKTLSKNGILCFAATHDIELTDLLKDYYENYHFEEEIAEGDIRFNYKLLEGKATTRNAIRLLELLGYDSELIEEAYGLAEHFMQIGVWE